MSKISNYENEQVIWLVFVNVPWKLLTLCNVKCIPSFPEISTPPAMSSQFCTKLSSTFHSFLRPTPNLKQCRRLLLMAPQMNYIYQFVGAVSQFQHRSKLTRKLTGTACCVVSGCMYELFFLDALNASSDQPQVANTSFGRQKDLWRSG